MMVQNLVVVTSSILHTKIGAAYSRLHSYKQAVGDNFAFYVLELNQFSKSLINHSYKDPSIRNINFLEVPERQYNYFYRNIAKLINFSQAFRLVRFLRNSFDIKSTILLYSTSNFPLFLATIFLRIFYGYTVVIEKNELETGVALNVGMPNSLKTLPLFFFLPFKLLFALLIDLFTLLGSKIIVISSNLRKLYCYHKRLFEIPILASKRDFFQKRNNKIVETKITKFIYIGYFTLRKDAIFQLLKVVSKNQKLFRGKAEFHFIGDGTKKIKKKLEFFIFQNSLEDIVFFKPPIPYRDIPSELRNYDVAILLRKFNLQTHFGLATKLCEYLMSGIPVLTNDISDHNRYLTDGHDSFFIDKVSTNQIEDKIYSIISMKDKIEVMRKNCVETGLKYFEIDNFSQELVRVFSR